MFNLATNSSCDIHLYWIQISNGNVVLLPATQGVLAGRRHRHCATITRPAHSRTSDALLCQLQLYFCEFCLKFFRRKSELTHHASKCTAKHPPGDEVYRGAPGVSNISMWEVDGVKEKQYCHVSQLPVAPRTSVYVCLQNLCYIAKMFLDHKTLHFDVDLFFFYVMTGALHAT